MLIHIKILLKDRFLLALAIIITIFIAVLSLMKIGEQPLKISFLDKIEHTIAYFVLTLIWLITLNKKKIKYIIIIFCLFYGIIIEVLQTRMTSYRTGDYLDVIANSIGIFIALLTFNFFFEKKQSI